MEAFISHIGAFPIGNLESRTHIRFLDFEEELIQVWYRCYLIKAWENHSRNGEVLPSECSGTPDELLEIFRVFRSLSDSERSRVFMRYMVEIHNIVRGSSAICPTIQIAIRGQHTYNVDGILDKLSEAKLNLKKSRALGMSMHHRLGQNSMVHALPHELVQRIWTHVPE
jgi:hypothetical protein